MFKPYRVASQNEESYRRLCKVLSCGQSVFQYQYNGFIKDLRLTEEEERREKQETSAYINSETDGNRSPSLKRTKLDISTKSSIAHSDLNETTISGVNDIKDLQRSVISFVSSGKKVDLRAYKSVEPQEVCKSNISAISDEVLIEVCNKSDQYEEDIIALLATLIILPKLYHLSSPLSTHVSNALTKFGTSHPDSAVKYILTPILQYCPTLENHHRDILSLFLADSSPLSVTQLLSAISMREAKSEVEVQTFQQLCENADHESDTVHRFVLTFLSKSSGNYKTNVKFGHCLLFIVKKMGPHMNELETLQQAVNTHSSSLKKGIEVQLKKISRHR